MLQVGGKVKDRQESMVIHEQNPEKQATVTEEKHRAYNKYKISSFTLI